MHIILHPQAPKGPRREAPPIGFANRLAAIIVHRRRFFKRHAALPRRDLKSRFICGHYTIIILVCKEKYTIKNGRGTGRFYVIHAKAIIQPK